MSDVQASSAEVAAALPRKFTLTQPQLLFACGLLSLLIAALAVFLYDRLLAPRPRPIAVVNLQSVLEAKEAQFSDIVVRQGISDAERKQAVDSVDWMMANLRPALAALSAECNCILLIREAVVGPAELDLTPQLLGKVGLADINVDEVRARVQRSLASRPVEFEFKKQQTTSR